MFGNWNVGGGAVWNCFVIKLCISNKHARTHIYICIYIDLESAIFL